MNCSVVGTDHLSVRCVQISTSASSTSKRELPHIDCAFSVVQRFRVRVRVFFSTPRPPPPSNYRGTTETMRCIVSGLRSSCVVRRKRRKACTHVAAVMIPTTLHCTAVSHLRSHMPVPHPKSVSDKNDCLTRPTIQSNQPLP